MCDSIKDMSSDINVLPVDEATEILDRVYSRGVVLYAKLHKMYIEICEEFEKTSILHTRNQDFITKISKLGVFLYTDISEATRENEEFSDMVRSMLCQNVDKCFLRCMSNRSSYMGYHYLGITKREINNIRVDGTEDEVISNVFDVLEPIMTKLTGSGHMESIANASKCFKASYDMRRSRHSLCIKSYDSRHGLKKRLDLIISDMLTRWLYDFDFAC